MFDATLSHYSCNGVTFNSKIAAGIYAKTVNKPIEWVFGLDPIYSVYPWDIEPNETLDELYDKRARELREKYDYILLSYSGGSDSHNVLMSFYRQGLHIDEVITNHQTEASKNFTVLDAKNTDPNNYNAEYQLNSVHRLNFIRDNMPHTKITCIDLSEYVLNGLVGLGDDWVIRHKEYFGSVSYLLRHNTLYAKEIKKQFDKGKQIAYVFGTDKPSTIIKNNTLFLRFFDTAFVTTQVFDYDDSDYTNVSVIPFYWGQTTAPMICKQVHTIKRVISLNPHIRRFWEKDYNRKIFRLVHEPIYRNILYTTWNDNWYQAQKAWNSWKNSEYDLWWQQAVKGTQQELVWERGLEFLISNADNILKFDKLGNPTGTVAFLKQYKIDSV
jgi:hypothetical protein